MREQHGARRTRLYVIWTNMKARCLNPRNPAYASYGGRGIEICKDWRESFIMFRRDMGEPSPGMEIDRIDNDKGYSPENCRWATCAEQSRNRRSARLLEINGTTKSMSEWAAETGISIGTVWSRLRLGWSAMDAVFRPFTPQRERNCGRRKTSLGGDE
jgi:hypothetical protein